MLDGGICDESSTMWFAGKTKQIQQDLVNKLVLILHIDERKHLKKKKKEYSHAQKFNQNSNFYPSLALVLSLFDSKGQTT